VIQTWREHGHATGDRPMSARHQLLTELTGCRLSWTAMRAHA
jgi:hypothetical protein